MRSTRDKTVDNFFFLTFVTARNESWSYITINCYCYSMSTFQTILFATFIWGPVNTNRIYLNPHINFYHRFFFTWWSYRSHETNESADRETASFWNCSPQWLFAVHHGNSLVYAFAEVSTVLIFSMQIFVLTKQQTGLFWIDVCAGLNLFGWCPSPQW